MFTTFLATEAWLRRSWACCAGVPCGCVTSWYAPTAFASSPSRWRCLRLPVKECKLRTMLSASMRLLHDYFIGPRSGINQGWRVHSFWLLIQGLGRTSDGRGPRRYTPSIPSTHRVTPVRCIIYTQCRRLAHCAIFCAVEGVTVYISDFKRSLADKLSKNFFSEPSQVMARPRVHRCPGQVHGPLCGDPH